MESGTLPVGEFGKRTGLGVKALRHYDRIGLLVPASQDAVTGYRYYAESQVPTGQRISNFRRIGIPVELVRRLLSASPEEVAGILREARARTEAGLTWHQRRLHMLDMFIKSEGKSMPTTPAAVDTALERRMGVDLFNHVWTLLEKERRTVDEDDEMVHAAHASRFHWSRAGGPVQFCRGEWQVSRVYSVLGRSEPAIHHATRCLELCREHSLEGFDLAIAYEALARAHGVAGDQDQSLAYAADARKAAEKITGEVDRRIFEGDMASLPH